MSIHKWECSDIPGVFICNLCLLEGIWDRENEVIVESISKLVQMGG